MFKILIAEDKRLTREGMVRLTDWDSAGQKLFLTAGNGGKRNRILKKPSSGYCNYRYPDGSG